jgi:hypothetical protein
MDSFSPSSWVVTRANLGLSFMKSLLAGHPGNSDMRQLEFSFSRAGNTTHRASWDYLRLCQVPDLVWCLKMIQISLACVRSSIIRYLF